MTREEALKGLECCAEFLCDECPYKIYSHIDYKFRCNYKLISDLKETMPKAGTWIKVECSEKNGDANCSICGHWDWSDCKYCSNCGAKMSKEPAND